ncbi:DNA-processing protein DprA [Microbulbifer sp. SSSA008]|uniref:DNA-processing protein DprA n=1 Tax=Microbulbifer sp. SSSA008 TaxID=3243380 RepID=UPI00403A695D
MGACGYQNTPPNSTFFVSQNRLQLGLSQPSLIVESEASEGSMKYVDFCLQAKHKLFVYYFCP